MREENERLISECLRRRDKVLALRTKVYYGFATLLNLFGAGPPVQGELTGLNVLFQYCFVAGPCVT